MTVYIEKYKANNAYLEHQRNAGMYETEHSRAGLRKNIATGNLKYIAKREGDHVQVAVYYNRGEHARGNNDWYGILRSWNNGVPNKTITTFSGNSSSEMRSAIDKKMKANFRRHRATSEATKRKHGTKHGKTTQRKHR